MCSSLEGSWGPGLIQYSTTGSINFQLLISVGQSQHSRSTGISQQEHRTAIRNNIGYMQNNIYVIYYLSSIFIILLYQVYVYNYQSSHIVHIQNLFLTAQSTHIKSVISVPIKDCIHHYPRALFNDIPRVGAYFYDIPGSGHSLTTYPG